MFKLPENEKSKKKISKKIEKIERELKMREYLKMVLENLLKNGSVDENKISSKLRKKGGFDVAVWADAMAKIQKMLKTMGGK